MNQQASLLIQAEIALAGITPEQEQLLQRLESRRITPDRELPQLEFLFRLKKPCFARGELVAVSGKAKSGKTFVCSVLMTLCFSPQVLTLERKEPGELSVMWYDTEQSEESTQDILRNRIIPMVLGHTEITESTEICGGSQKAQITLKQMMDIFDIFNVRAEGYDQRLPLLEAAVRHYHPDLVILDGIRDLVSDINDGVIAQDCIERLMHLASEERCCMVCILHQNKSVEDRNLRGWIGTELKNKAFEVYECVKSSERIFNWSQTDTRKYDIPEPVSFAVNDKGLPYRCTNEQLIDAQMAAQRKMADKLHQGNPLPDLNPKYARKEGRKHTFDTKQLFPDIMEPHQVFSEEDLRREIYIKTNAVKDKLQLEIIAQGIKDGVILSCINPLGKKEYVLSPR